LLLQSGGLVKTICFKKPNYIGDPINAVRIFNEKEVDELVILDITASKENKAPNFDHLEEMVSEAFMPLGYGGGLNTLDHIKRAFDCGIEKVVINNAAYNNLQLISKSDSIYGNQSIVGAVDVTMNFLGKYATYSHVNAGKGKLKPLEHCKFVEEAGAGEIFLTAIHREGTFKGYDTQLIESISRQVNIPVVANGGARHLDDFKDAIEVGASAVAAGSRFVYTGRENGIMINYPTQKELKQKLFEKL
jgi:cyclase